MKVFDNYSQYRKESPNYIPWKDEKNIQEAKRLEYIDKHGINAENRHSDIQRAEAILNCIDVMDEYSQARAEDMEVVTNQGKSFIMQLGMYVSMGIGFLYYYLSKSLKNNIKELFNKNFKSVPKLILPSIIVSLPIFASIMAGSLWGAGKEIKASQIGRAEAINTKLNSPKQFAELTDEQEEEVNRIAETIRLSPKEAKKLSTANRGWGIFKSIKTIFSSNKREMETLKDISIRTQQDKELFDKVKLTDKEIEEAKKDKQLIQNVVEKIDIASQDYAEDVELATGAITTAAFAGGFLSGFITNKILSKIPGSLQKHSKSISILVGVILALGSSIYCTKVQKQASRVGRFKVKQDFMNNPEKLLYVDDDKITDEDGTKYLNTNKKPGFFKFICQIFKENKEYNKYLKTEYVESKKRSMAREKIKITPEQEKRAKQLQLNTFKMFNKLDEKSQAFSESVEAVGEMFSGTVTSLIELVGFGISAIMLAKSNSAKQKNLSIWLPFISALGIAIPLQVYITKQQKKASKVANMLAIKELDDYRNFADYSNKTETNQSKANLPK